MNEKIKVGNYLIIGVKGDYSVMEQFGSYRMLKKKFKTIEKATKRIEDMDNFANKYQAEMEQVK